LWKLVPGRNGSDDESTSPIEELLVAEMINRDEGKGMSKEA